MRTPEERRIFGEKRGAVSHLIRHELRLKGFTLTRLAKEIGCSSVNVSKAVSGISHSPIVLDALHAKGITEKYIFDPRISRAV